VRATQYWLLLEVLIDWSRSPLPILIDLAGLVARRGSKKVPRGSVYPEYIR